MAIGQQWFRMYAKFATDPDVQMMSESYQRRWVMLLCMKCNGHETLHDSRIAFQLRVTPQEWADTKREFVALGFIDESNNVIKWDQRQYRSDYSTERVYKHREKKKNEQLQKQPRNVTVTPPEQNRTEQNRTEKPTVRYAHLAEEVYALYPRKVGKSAALKAITKALKSIEQSRLCSLDEAAVALMQKVREFAASPAGNRGEYTPHCSTWMNQGRWNDDPSEWQRTEPKPNGKPPTTDFQPPRKLNPDLYREQ